MFQQFGSRIKMPHLNDRKPGFPETQVKNDAAEHFTEVGAGTIDWKSILRAAEVNGVKQFFVERDSGNLPAFECLQISFQNLQAFQWPPRERL
jgi:sugar phosphate isomerase/epimerase